MRLGYFTMPLHPIGRNCTQTLQEDRQAIILADKLGFYDAFVGEHLTEITENIVCSMLFLATLISDTKTIKLATGTSNISQWHPAMLASHAAMFDHLAQGRFIFGISPGILRCDAEALGILNEDRNKLFAEAIDVILEIWKREQPYDIDLPDNRYKVTTRTTRRLEIGRGHLYKPYQTPHPEIVGTVVAPYSKGVIAMGRRDFHPLSANFLMSRWLPTHWANYEQGKKEVGKVADRNDPVTVDSDVALNPRVATPIEDKAPAQDEVVHRRHGAVSLDASACDRASPVPSESVLWVPTQQALRLRRLEPPMRQVAGDDERLERARHRWRLDRRLKGTAGVGPTDEERRRTR